MTAETQTLAPFGATARRDVEAAVGELHHALELRRVARETVEGLLAAATEPTATGQELAHLTAAIVAVEIAIGEAVRASTFARFVLEAAPVSADDAQRAACEDLEAAIRGALAVADGGAHSVARARLFIAWLERRTEAAAAVVDQRVRVEQAASELGAASEALEQAEAALATVDDARPRADASTALGAW